MKKLFSIFFTVSMALMLITVYPCYKSINTVVNNEVSIEESKEEKKLREFITAKMMDENGGVFTNYLDKENDGDITKGHFILSESQGLLLQYYLKVNNKDGFRATYDYITKNMMLEDGLISWRISEDIKEECSATIDDLRIISALLKGSDKYKVSEYRDLAINISNSLYDNIIKDNYIVDFKDKYGCGNISTVCYQDIQTLKALSNIDSKWEVIYKQSISLIQGAVISNDIPLYSREFNTDTLTYDNDSIDMLLSTLTIKNLAAAGEDVSNNVKWIKKKFKEDKVIYTSYLRSNGEVDCNYESTSIYATICDISKIVNDEELYKLAKNRMLKFQISDVNSELYGAFGDNDKKEIYSFDNLNALISL